ncbi:MAG: OmpA family protein [Bacteroidota bacterium]|nr:OmpA family protein [Bacteroidota bacterium]
MQNRFISFFLVLATALNAQSYHTAGVVQSAPQTDSIKVEIKNIGDQVNSPFVDYAPLISADGSIMVFTSRKPLIANKIKNLKDHIYYSNFDKKKMKWSNAIPFSDTINVPSRNNSAISILNNGQQMLIYRDDLNTNGDIYESHLEGSSWTEPVNMGEPINSADKEPSACISPDGGTIYFVSDREGGLGGFDIWYSTKDSIGKWGEAKNMGAPINSIEDEDGLFIHSDGKTLFFSSKGHNSMGGYDVFMSVLDNTTKVASSPKNLGPSINTSGDDLYFVMEANGKTGYYSSNRLGGFGEKDIYQITFLENIMKGNLRLLKGRVLDKKGNPIVSKIIVKDKATGNIIGTFASNSATGKYLITLPADKNYELEFTADGYIPYSYSIESSNKLGYKGIEKDIVLESKTLAGNAGEVNEETLSIAKGAKTSKGDKNPTVFGRVLDENGNPLKVLIEVIDNNTNNVVGKYENSVSTGIFNLRLKGGDYRIVFSKPCYLFKSVYVVTSNSAGYKKDLGDINMELVGVGKKIVLDFILFDYTKASLREESYSTLDRTIRLMNSLESLEIEISGHTDNISSAAHNQMLSEERAKEVMKYLIRMGIDGERLRSKGYGFIQPVASNDSEMGRQLNRRTELKVLKVDLEAEQIAEIKRLKESLTEVKENPDVTNLAVGQESDKNSPIPDRFKQYDTENNDKISYSEIIPFIDSFLEGTQKMNAEEITALIDYYLEQ